MRLRKTGIPGCYEIRPEIFRDRRGRFVKTFHEDLFRENGLETRFAEEYYTYSRNGVLRGLHFQIPPRDYTKLVYCVVGEVLDAVVDLRIGSPTYGKHETFPLSAENASAIYMPPGIAHGFLVTGEEAILAYKVTSSYSREHDTGILWSSAGISWGCRSPIISERDSGFVTMNEFLSPFMFNRPSSDD